MSRECEYSFETLDSTFHRNDRRDHLIVFFSVCPWLVSIVLTEEP